MLFLKDDEVRQVSEAPPRRDRRQRQARSVVEAVKGFLRDATSTGRTGRDRRATRRVLVQLEAADLSGDAPRLAKTEDLSAFGVMIQSDHRYEPGERLLLGLDLPDGPLTVHCEVIRWDERRKRAHFAFRDPSAAVVKRVYRFVARGRGGK